MKYSCIVLFLVLLVRASIQSTIFVDNVDYNYVTTEVPVFVADTTTATLANAGRFTLESVGGLSIETSGPVQLTGSFVHLDSDSSFIQNAGGDITIDGSDSFTVGSSKLNITGDGSVSFTTTASYLNVNVGGSVEALVDQAYIISDGSVSINSGGGNVELYSDHIVTYNGQNSNILGENRVTFETLYDFKIDAVNSFESRSNLLDFNTLGDIRITSTTDNVNFVAGTELKLEGDSIFFNADEGIDVSSIHGDIFVDASDDVLVTSLDTVDFEINDDANFISENGPISVKSDDFTADADVMIYLEATDLQTTSENFKIDTVVTVLDTQGSIQFSFSGDVSGTSVFNAEEEFLIQTNIFNSNSDTLLITTNQPNAGSVVFQSNGGDESYFSTDSVGDTHFTAARNMDVFSGSIEYSADNIIANGATSLNIIAEFKAFDFINVETPTITLSGTNEVINGNLGEIEANLVSFTHNQNFNINVDQDDGTLSFESGNNTKITFTTSALFSSIDESLWDAYSLSFDAGNAPITANVFSDVNFFSSAIGFTVSNAITSNSYRANFVSNAVSLSATGSISMTSSFFDFWANLAANFTTAGADNFSFTNRLTFRAFENMVMTDLRNFTASSFLGFEAAENIDIFAANFSAFAKSLSLTSNSRSDLSWTGQNFISTSKNTNFEAPSSSFSALDTLDLYGSSEVIIKTILEHFIRLQTKSNWNLNAVNSIISSDHDLRMDGSSFTFTANNSFVQSSSSSMEYLTGKEFGITANTMNINSGGDIFVETNTDIVFTTISTVDFSVNRNTSLVAKDTAFISKSINNFNFYNFNISTIAPEYYDRSAVNFNTLGDTSITLSGEYYQAGGNLDYTITGKDNYAAAAVLSINSVAGSDITTDGNLFFNAPNTKDTVRIQSMDYLVVAKAGIDFLAGDITITSNRTQNIYFDSAHNVTINTHNNKPFTWTSRDDINSTIGNFTVRANVKDDQNNSISFVTTHPEGNFIANVRSGWLNFQSRDSQNYNADYIELFAANDLTFNTSLSLSPNTGGITFTTDGFLHNAVNGEKSGISFTTTGILDSIYLTSSLGKETYFSGFDMTVESVEGNINVLANQIMQFNSTKGNILISSSDFLTFVTDNGNITFSTTTGNTEVRSSDTISYLAATNIYLTSTDPITKTNGRAFEFTADSGDINVKADSDSNIEWTAGGEIDTQSAESTTQFANLGIFYTATTGRYLANSKAGIKLLVQNGDLNLNASDSVNFSSGNNWDIFVSSGQSSSWTALTQGAEFSAAENTTIRTERSDVVFHTEVGNIFAESTGQIRFQADGTTNNPAGSNVDGIFVQAPNIDIYAFDKSVIESEAIVYIGATTTPVVIMEAGGSAAAPGVIITSVGDIDINIGEDVNIQSGYDFISNAAREFDLTTTGSISITTLGTDPTGKDFVVRTPSELAVTAGDDISITSKDSASFLTHETINFNVTGGSTSYIDVNSYADFVLEVNHIMDVNAADWTAVAQDKFNVVVLDSLVFTNVFPSITGQITIYGDNALDFVGDSYVTVKASGANGNITMSTIGSNSDLNIETQNIGSDVSFLSYNTFSSYTADDLHFSTVGLLKFESYDNVDDGVENGNIIFTTPDDFKVSSNTITVEGDKGVRFATKNKADINLQSAGSFFTEARQKMIFDSVNGTLDLSANNNLYFSTYLGGLGDIAISTTRDLFITADDDADFEYDGDLSIGAVTINFDSNSGSYLSLITEGKNGEMDLNADIINVSGGRDSNLIGTTVAFQSVGTGYLHADLSVSLRTRSNHGHINFYGGSLFQTVGPSLISITALNSQNSPYYDTAELLQNNGRGFINVTSYGVNPEFGYGILLNATNTITMTSKGNIIATAPGNTVNVTANDVISFLVQTPQNSQNAISISASGTDGKLYSRSFGQTTFASSSRTTFYSGSSIQFYPYDQLAFTANGPATVDLQHGIEILTTLPNAGMEFITTDYLTGSIHFNAAINEVFAERGLNFHLEDDDDADSVGTYQIQGPEVSIQAENSGTIQSIAGGDVVTRGAFVHIHAGDDFSISVRQQLYIFANTWDITTATPMTFTSGNSVDYYASATTNFYVAGDSTFVATDTLFLEAQRGGTVTLTNGADPLSAAETGDVSPSTFYIFSQGDQNYNSVANNVGAISINTAKNRVVDFVDGIRIPSAALGGGVTTDTICTAVGINGTPREFIFNTSNNSFCYCSSLSSRYICAETHQAIFPY